MLDTPWNDVHFSGSKVDGPVSELKCHLTIKDDKDLIRIHMRVPNELALNFGEFELVVIHFCDNAR